MSRREESHSREIADTLRALRRAARRALELGIQTGTPVYVWKNNRIVDLTKAKAIKKIEVKALPKIVVLEAAFIVFLT